MLPLDHWPLLWMSVCRMDQVINLRPGLTSNLASLMGSSQLWSKSQLVACPSWLGLAELTFLLTRVMLSLPVCWNRHRHGLGHHEDIPVSWSKAVCILGLPGLMNSNIWTLYNSLFINASDRRKVFLLLSLFLETWQHPGCWSGKERREGLCKEAEQGGPVGWDAGVWGRAGSSVQPGQLSLPLRVSAAAMQQVQTGLSLSFDSTHATTGQGSGWPWITQVQTLN